MDTKSMDYKKEYEDLKSIIDVLHTYDLEDECYPYVNEDTGKIELLVLTNDIMAPASDDEHIKIEDITIIHDVMQICNKYKEVSKFTYFPTLFVCLKYKMQPWFKTMEYLEKENSVVHSLLSKLTTNPVCR